MSRRREREGPDLIRAIVSDIEAYEIADRILGMLPDDADRPPGWDVRAEVAARPELAGALRALGERLDAARAGG
ncbi:MAG: hypothetical protein KF768_14380 [Phycisphaeraceae bacterium]|nr:hypothetical protein [Phycisphaeraceae bacterium]